MLVINSLGILIIGFIVWWFWLYKPKENQISADTVVITVANGNYSPAYVQIPSGQETRLRFLRKDESPCAAMVQIPDAELSVELPLNKVKEITLPAMEKGEHVFHCQMQMYRGKLIAE